MSSAIQAAESPLTETEAVKQLVTNGRVAMQSLTRVDQARVDEAVAALAWSATFS